MRRVFDNCPRCGALLIPTASFAGPPCKSWLECSECNTFVNTYIPQEHQEELHLDPATFIGNFGGYGSGKTTTSYQEVLKHVIITPHANVLIGANVTSQYEQTIKRDLEADLPSAFVSGYSLRYAYVDLINGARIIYRPFDDPEKLRSYNITMFVMLEGSEVKQEAYTQLKMRLRNLAAAKQAVDEQGHLMWEYDDKGRQFPVIACTWYKGIIESNPDPGWVRSEILLNAGKIKQFGRAFDEYYVDEARKDPAISAYITSTDANRYLPPKFIENTTKNRPPWWVARYIYGSFSYSEGLVYPNALKHVRGAFDVDPSWKRLAAHDWGLVDDSVFLFAAIDEDEGIVYIYKELRTRNRNVEELAAVFKRGCEDIPVGAWYTTPLIDPVSGGKRDPQKRTLSDLYVDQGIIFQPGAISVDARVMRLNTYIESGKLVIMDCCTGLIDELRDYKFRADGINRDQPSNKPEDKNNHAINALEWICMALPADPKNILYGVYNKFGNAAGAQTKKEDWMPHALRDESPYRGNTAELAYGIEQFQEFF